MGICKHNDANIATALFVNVLYFIIQHFTTSDIMSNRQKLLN